MKKTISGYQEATRLIYGKFGSKLNQDFSGSVLHTDGSSPYASLRSHQVFVILSALVNSNASVVTIANSSGFLKEFDYLWSASVESRWSFGTSKHTPYHFRPDIVRPYSPVFGGLKECAEKRKDRIVKLYKRICPEGDPDRLVVHDLARGSLFQNFSLRDYFASATIGDRVGKIPCPYCSIRWQRKYGDLSFIYHDVNVRFPNISVDSWHAKCPCRKILIRSFFDESLSKVMQETGFALTGRSALALYTEHLSHIGVEKIVVKDYPQSSMVMDRVVGKLQDPNQLIVSTRTEIGLSVDQLEDMETERLLKLIKSHRLVSDGTIFKI